MQRRIKYPALLGIVTSFLCLAPSFPTGSYARNFHDPSTVQPISLRMTEALPGTWQTGMIQPNDSLVSPSMASIQAMTLGPDGDLYLGGDFSSIDGFDVPSVARWDGTAWSGLPGAASDQTIAFPPAYDPSVATMMFMDDDLYLGGKNMNLGGMFNLDLARWDGTLWQSTGSGIVAEDAGIRQLATYNHEVYMLGTFHEFNGVEAHALIRWDGTTITPMHLPDFIDMITMLSTSDGVYFSGITLIDEDEIVFKQVYWDGTQFHDLPLDVSSTSLKVFNDHLYGITYQGSTSALMRWNGSMWVTVLDNIPGQVADYALDADDIYIKADQNLHYHGNTVKSIASCLCAETEWIIAHNRLFNRTPTELWSYINDTWVQIAVYRAPAPDQLQVRRGGQATYIYDERRWMNPTLAFWKTNSWESLTNTLPFPFIKDIEGAADQTLYAMGPLDNSAHYRVYRIDPVSKQVTFLPELPNDWPEQFDILTDQTIVVRGSQGFYRWNGNQWEELGFPAIANPVPTIGLSTNLFTYQQQLFLLGIERDGLTHRFTIYRWDGSSWILETTAPFRGTLHDFDTNAQGLYMVGVFDQAGQQQHVMRWDGRQFHGMGRSNNRIDTVAATDTGIYVGGLFSDMTTCDCQNLAYWDGAAWFHIDQAPNGHVADLAFTDGQLAVYGSFSRVNATTAFGLALWNPEANPIDQQIYLPLLLLRQ